jgi:acetoacetate decarboxylase
MPNLSFFDTHTADYYDAETLGVLWLTTPDAVAELLPPPLEPMEMPLILGFVARFPKVSFDTPYLMGGMFMYCKYKGEIGSYVLSAPESDDFPVFAGREVLGYPKKMAHLELERNGDKMTGFIERRGVRLVEIRANLNGEANSPMGASVLSQMTGPLDPSQGKLPESDGINFLFKFAHSAAPDKAFEWPPKIVRQVTRMRPRRMEIGNAEVLLKSSPSDSPWGRVPVAQMLGAFSSISHNTMLPPTVIAEVDETAFLPYSYLKYEW